jgi:outer membrane protein OmpA-like peptidoglycan-associated protein
VSASVSTSPSVSTSASPSESLTPEQVAAALLTDAHLLSQQTIATALATANNTLAQAQIAAASKLAIAELLAAEKLAAQKIALAALVSSSPVLPAAQTITFTDTTLMDGFASLAYSDFLLAKTLTESQLSGQFVTYGLFGNLPLGVTFDSKTGILSGVISKEAVIGFYPITIAAFSQGYATQVLNLNWRVLPAPITASATPTPSSSAVLTSAAVLSILFTDTTLVKGIIGRTYTDYVQAKTFSGNVYTEERVSYSLVGSLPAGLTLSSSTGYISGIILNGTTPGVYKVLVSAFAKGYPTQVYPYDFNVVSASAAVVTPTASPTPTTTSLPIPPTKIILMDTVWFDSGKSLLTSSSRASLNLMIAKLIKSPYKIVTVYGYTDAVKGKPHPTLSLARANVVRSYLLAKTNDIKVSAIGLGVAPTSTYSSKSLQQSRKAEIWVA